MGAVATEISGRQIQNLRVFYLAHRPPEEQAYLDSIDPEKWYPLEEFLPIYRNYIRRNPEAARWQMRSFAYIFRDQLVREGVRTPQEALDRLPDVYFQTTRGETGFGYRALSKEVGHCILEKDTWGDCYAALGTLEGMIKSFGGRSVRIRHISCKAVGDDRCIYDVSWREPGTAGHV